MEKLKKNIVFQIAVPIVCIAAVLVCEYFLHGLYADWIFWQGAVVYTAMIVCFAVLSFWTALERSEERKSLLNTLIFTAVGTAVCSAVFVGSGSIVNSIAGGTMAFWFQVVATNAVLFGAIGYSVAGICKINGKKAAIISVASVLVTVLVAMSVFVGVSANSTDAIKTFSTVDMMRDGRGQDVKIIILAGQSNASGTTHVDYLCKNSNAEDYQTYLNGYDNVLINYFVNNGTNSSKGYFLPVTINQGRTDWGFGPEIGMADELSKSFGGETVIILKYSWGGSNLHSQWRSPSSGETGDLYEAFVNFINTYIDYLESKNYNPTIGAMCWMQGESDAQEPHCNAYGEYLADMVGDIRREFAENIAEDGMYFIDAGISDSPNWAEYETINAAKVSFAETSDINIYIDTIGAGLRYDAEPTNDPDLAHYDSLSELELGRLFGRAVAARYGK